MQHVRLIASDLDGTLLHRDGSISERTRHALQQAQAAGIQVVLVSGRPPRYLREKVQEAGITGLQICSNGAILYDPESDEIVAHLLLEPDVARRLILGLREAIPGVVFGVERGREFAQETAFNSRWERTNDLITSYDDALDLCTAPITKLLARHPNVDAETLARRAQAIIDAGEATITYSSIHSLEISSLGVHKAAALETLCERLSIRSEEVVAFGDMPNDIAMLRWAGCGVAVANAHPEVLAEADETTDSNEDDGVASYVEHLVASLSETQPAAE